MSVGDDARLVRSFVLVDELVDGYLAGIDALDIVGQVATKALVEVRVEVELVPRFVSLELYNQQQPQLKCEILIWSEVEVFDMK